MILVDSGLPLFFDDIFLTSTTWLPSQTAETGQKTKGRKNGR